MRKLLRLSKTLLVAAGLLVGVNSAWAYTPALSEEYSVIGFTKKAFYDIANDNVGTMCPTSGDLRFRGSGYGLFNFASGNRGADITLSVSNTDLVIVEFKDSQNRSVTVNSISNCTKNETLSSGDFLAFDVTEDATSVNINLGRGGCIIAILVMEKDNDAATADYTINYKLNGTTIKTDNGNVAVGTVIPVSASFFVENVKYYALASQAESLTVEEGGNTLDINVRVAFTWNWILNSSLGGQIATNAAYEGETVKAPYPRYILDGSTLYEAGTTNKEYRKDIIMTADNVAESVTYSAAKENVVFYSEGENIEGTTTTTSGNIPVRASNALAAITESDATITTLPAGAYKITVGVFTSRSSNFSTYAVKLAVGDETFTANPTAANLTVVSSNVYNVSEGTVIKFLAEGSSTDCSLDYIFIEKFVPATITAAGWSTLYTDYALDFSGVDGLTAYTATCDGSKVTLTAVENVLAGTGVVLKGAENTYNIPIAASSSTAPGDLKGSATDAKAYDTDYNYYYLAINGESKAQFKKLTSGSIAAGKAYLQLDKGITAPSFDIDFGGTTGINMVKGEESKVNGEYYNLAGQRVAQPTKGLYIVNGKKVVIK